MRKLLDKLRNQRGSSLIFGIAMAVFILLLSLVIMAAVKTRTTLSFIQTTAEQVLDDYTDEQGRNADESFKNGTDCTAVLDQKMYIEKLKKALGIGTNNMGETDGHVRFILSDITLSYTSGNKIDSTANIHAKIPLYWDKVQITSVEVTIKVSSMYESLHE